MKKNETKITATKLRKKVEAQVKQTKTVKPPKPLTALETKMLLHELQVHQIELEMQNHELRESRAEVEAELEHYSELYDFAPVSYFTLDRTGAISRTNLAGTQLLGLERTRLIGKRFGAFVAKSDTSAFNAFLQRVFATEVKQTCELNLVRKNKPPLIVQVEAALPADGQECRAVVVVDISVRRNAEEKLRASEQLYRTLIENLPNSAVYLFDHDLRYTLVGGPLTSQTGFDQAKMEGKTLEEVLPPEHATPLAEKYRRTLTGETVRYEPTLGEHVYDSQIIPVRDASGQVTAGIVLSQDITERKQAEQALRRSHLLLEESQSIARLGGWELNIITGELYWTAETYRIHDTSPEEFIPTVDAGVGYYLPESKATIIAALDAAMTRGAGYDLYLETYTAKGRKIDVRTTCVVTMESGKPIKLTGIFQDISERKEHDAQINFQVSLLGSVGEATIATDLTGTVTYFNRAAEELYGWSIEEAIGHNILEINVPDIAQDKAAEIMKLLSAGKTWSGEFMVKRRDGTIFPAAVSNSPILDENGNVIGIIGISTDVTKRKRTEEKLRESETRYVNVVKSAMDAIIGIDIEQRIILFNLAAEQMFGCNASEVMGQSIEQLIPNRYRSVHKKHINSFGLTGTTNRAMENLGTIFGLRTNGDEFPMEASISQIVAEGKKFYTVILRDITERKQAEEKILQQNETLSSFQQITLDLLIRKDTQSLLNDIVQYVLSFVNAQQAFIFLPEDDTLFLAAATQGFAKNIGRREPKPGTGVLGRVWQSAETLAVENYSEWEFRDPSYQSENLRALVGIPIKAGNAIIGVLEVVNTKTTHQFTPIELQSLTHFAELAALVLDNAQLLDSNQYELAERKRAEKIIHQRVSQLSLLSKISAQITAELDTNKILEQGATLVKSGFGYQHVGLFFPNKEQTVLVLHSQASIDPYTYPAGHHLQFGEGMVGTAAKLGTTLLTNNVAIEPNYVNLYPNTISSQSELSIPIRIGKTLLGILDIQSLELNAFDENDVMVMETLADQIAIALENARLYQEIQVELYERKLAEEKVKSSLAEKEILLKEIHHRVKNNLQVISSLLYLQSLKIKDENMQEMFRESQNRIASMALIHEKLYQSTDLAHLSFSGYARDLASSLFQSYGVEHARVALAVEDNGLVLDIENAVPCGLIINEIISNSLKYAFVDNRQGKIQIILSLESAERFNLTLSDDGAGLPADFETRSAASLGSKLIERLVQQIQGTLERVSSEQGTRYVISFPREA